jgi:DNA-binding FadR family transcriptional regulator
MTAQPSGRGAVAAMAVLGPGRRGNAFEETVERLLQTIKLGLVRQGERLPAERDLSAELGVSRVTLREAIRALQQAGYVESRRGRYGGTFVTYEPSLARSGQLRRIVKAMGSGLVDALCFRDIVEPGAAAAAARADISPAERALLIDRLTDATQAELPGYRQADSRFHLTVAELAGSPMLLAAVADVRMRLNDLLDAIPLLERNIEHSNDQHAAIVSAILAGDPEGAESTMRDHLAGTAALLRAFLG